MDKFIVPVSFINTWPPKCLAIQFATTQYIPWIVGENNNSAGTYIQKCFIMQRIYTDATCDDTSMRVWSQCDVISVAEEISRCLKSRELTSNVIITSYSTLT